MADRTDLEKNKFAQQDWLVAINATQSLPGVGADITEWMNINDLESQKFVGDNPVIRIVKTI